MSNDVIVTRTPLRISFAGGGTDLPCFYKNEGGAVLSTAIDKYVYITIKRHGALFDEPIRLNYSETEMVHSVGAIRNDIARECLRFLEITPPVYISTIGDVPASSGLGSSSSFAVGLLKGLHAFRGERVPAGVLAEEAARIEMDILGRPIGKQDHYAAAYGGLHLYRFLPDGGVSVEAQTAPADPQASLFRNLLLVWTGITRDAASVLRSQRDQTDQHLDELRTMRDSAVELKQALQNGYDAAAFGAMLDHTWRLKRQLASAISNDSIDAWYERAMRAGALGGKISGAGGGGFLLLVVTPERREQVRAALSDLRELPIAYEARGSQVLHPAQW